MQGRLNLIFWRHVSQLLGISYAWSASDMLTSAISTLLKESLQHFMFSPEMNSNSYGQVLAESPVQKKALTTKALGSMENKSFFMLLWKELKWFYALLQYQNLLWRSNKTHLYNRITSITASDGVQTCSSDLQFTERPLRKAGLLPVILSERFASERFHLSEKAENPR